MSSITVLMTVYNGGEYLRGSLRSIIEQTYRDFECLVIDDASSDGSVQLVKSFNDPRIRIVPNQTNCGQTASLNRGLELAKGEWIARMDADDLISPRWLETMEAFARMQKEAAVVSARARAIDGEGRLIRNLNSPMSSEDIVLKSLVASPINHVGSLMRREVILKEGGYDQQFKISADYDLWSRLLRKGYVFACARQRLISVRFHRKSTTASEMEGKVVPEMTKVMKQNIAHFSGINLPQDTMVLFWRFIYAPEKLNSQEYCKMRVLLKEIYHSWKGAGIDEDQARRFGEHQLKISALKRFLGIWMPSFFKLY